MADSPSRKRATKQKGWRIDAQLAEEFTSFCEARGWNINRQVEVALRLWMEKQNAGSAWSGPATEEVSAPKPRPRSKQGLPERR